VLVEVTDGVAGTVIVAVELFDVSVIEVAVMVAVCEALVAAEAVKVAVLVVLFDSVPAPLTLQVTPAEVESLLTVAVNVVLSPPSTFAAPAVTETLADFAPPQPLSQNENVKRTTPKSAYFFADMTFLQRRLIQLDAGITRRRKCSAMNDSTRGLP